MPTGVQAIEFHDIIQPDRLATQIADQFREWNMYRNTWMRQKEELRNYIFAVDTTTTTNSINGWKNSTHIPKLCQIRDNLHSNYMAALFPSDQSIIWEGDDENSVAKDKRQAIEAYMANKMRQSGFWTTVSQLVLDWIDYGVCFAMPEFVAEYNVDPLTGEKSQGYVGPRVVRISPTDIVFNPAGEWKTTPKIIRSLHTLASLKAEIETRPEQQYKAEVFKRVIETRHQFLNKSDSDFVRETAYQVDGFSNFLSYLKSDYVELLDFYGDYYDKETGELYRNKIITVVDQSYIIRDVTNPSWLGHSSIEMCGWRIRPDNLYAMGPLDNLVGMQYRIDHLENAKADGFDLIIHPVIKVKGLVEDFNYGPNERIFVGEEGDVEFMSPDAGILAADSQVAMYQQQMEEMAGAPKQAMGFRTPGEKTAYEVQILENSANKIFLNKTTYFEMTFLEPLLNGMLEIGRRNMGRSEVIKVMDDDFGVANFLKVTRADINSKGKIRPVGARHFARNATIIQNLTQMYSSAIGQDPAVAAHVSGKAVARLMEQLLGVERFQLVQDNIRVYENAETQSMLQQISIQQQAETGGPQPGNLTVPTAGATGSPPASGAPQGAPAR